TAVLPALVYAYGLLGSVKELTALSMILTLGCLAVLHDRWLGAAPARAIPFALVVAAGVSALGVAFGAWALAAAAVLLALAAREQIAGRIPLSRLLATGGAGSLALLIAAWPTWIHVSRSFNVAQSIASTSNAGNLHTPLRAIQVLGVWLRGSYKLEPAGTALQLTHVLAGLTLLAAVLGAAHLLRIRAYPLAAWIACMLLAWLGVSESVTTWAGAKTLMLTSPVVMLLAWGGIAALRESSPRGLAQAAGWLGAVAIAGGVLASDALQYHSSNLAPTARYRELASLNSRLAGRGPALFTDFDEYAMYELRGLDIGGPDFVYPPPALGALARGYGYPVKLDRAMPAALAAYPLIITRREPAASRPPAAYGLVWQGAYYQAWRRRAGVAPALAHVALDGAPTTDCRRIEAAAKSASAAATLAAAPAPAVVPVPLAHASHPVRWGHQRGGLVMSSAGRLTASFVLPNGGAWELWAQGQFMPSVELRIDGLPLASIAGQLSGNSLVPNTVPPISVTLARGAHTVSVIRGRSTLGPGDGGSAVLDSLTLTPAASDRPARLDTVAASAWRTLCGRGYRWIELLAP
ncbi:MAG: hypothetical protein JWL67_2500, partial [Solirubrobacterales bacterium]|nr:hypothetical protein [Solirubrobacterales bacterium]